MPVAMPSRFAPPCKPLRRLCVAKRWRLRRLPKVKQIPRRAKLRLRKMLQKLQHPSSRRMPLARPRPQRPQLPSLLRALWLRCVVTTGLA